MRKKKTCAPEWDEASIGLWGTTSDGRCTGCNIPLKGSLKVYNVLLQELPISHRIVGTCPVCGKMAVVFRGA